MQIAKETATDPPMTMKARMAPPCGNIEPGSYVRNKEKRSFGGMPDSSLQIPIFIKVWSEAPSGGTESFDAQQRLQLAFASGTPNPG
ncbi:MAG: hypothetical protein WCJ29_02530 [bacterium]